MARVAASKAGFIGIDDLNTIEQFLSALNLSSRQIAKGTDLLCRTLAFMTLGYAQELSSGPDDPWNEQPGAAWKIPVRRITGAYLAGWQVKRYSFGNWELRNDSREAWFIEYGIHNGSSRAVRRPVLKLSVMKALELAAASDVFGRVWLMMYGPLGGRGYGHGAESLESTVPEFGAISA